jgi:hypothetical protein
MSRFDGARRGRIAVWTGAALAWGTAVTLAGQEPAQAGADNAETAPSVAIEAEDTLAPPVPTMPEKGLVIIRYRPSVSAAPEVQTVYVRQAAPRSAAPSPAPLAPSPAAPAPRSGGS